MSSIIRGAVSKEKRRYQKNGFDLDLSYVTPKIIAMGFPSENVEAAYRNPMKEVLRFLDSYHKDHYKVYNLCSERAYDHQKFYNRVGHFPFDDHNAPPFELILQFCRNVQEWLDEHEDNIAVIHCKAGKGRTGLMICAWLLFSRMWKTPEEALTFYAAMRTFNQKGVTIPSQIRYIYYFHESLALENPVIEPKLLLLNHVVLHTLPHTLDKHLSDVNFTVHVGKTLVFTYRDYADKMKLKEAPKIVKVEAAKKKKKKEKKKEKEAAAAHAAEDKGKQVEEGIEVEGAANGKEKEEGETVAEDTATFECGMIPVVGDVRVDFENKGARIFQFWFNTGFVKDLRLVVKKKELDKAFKDKHHKLYDENFRVGLAFTEMGTTTTPASARATLSSSSSSASILANGNVHGNGNGNGINGNGTAAVTAVEVAAVVLAADASSVTVDGESTMSHTIPSDSSVPVV